MKFHSNATRGTVVALSIFALLSVPAVAHAEDAPASGSGDTVYVPPADGEYSSNDPGAAEEIVDPIYNLPWLPPLIPNPDGTIDDGTIIVLPVPVLPPVDGGRDDPATVGPGPVVMSPLEAVTIRTDGRVVLGESIGNAKVNDKIVGTVTQDFTNGKVVWNPLKNSEAYAVTGNNATVWSNDHESSDPTLGLPVGPELKNSNGGSVQEFEHGKIISDGHTAKKVAK